MLVTGGTGALGGHVARWAAGRGARRVVLTSRSGPAAPGAAALAAALATAGAAAEVTVADVAERPQLGGLLTRIAVAGPALSSVLHTAGVLDDGVLDRLDAGRLALVASAKAGGAALLDELTADLDLDAFVLFSSAAAVFGGAGQGNYAAANAYLDALAEQRRGRGLAGTSVAWGPWAGGGLAQASTAVRARLRRGPLPELDPALAIEALGQVLDAGEGVLAVMDVDWAQFTAAPGAAQAPLLRDLPEAAQAQAAQPPAPDRGDLAGELVGLPPRRRRQHLTDLIREWAAAVLGHASADAIQASQTFAELGFDSLTALEMSQVVTAATGLRQPATLVFDYPSPAVLARHVAAQLLDEHADAQVPPSAPPAEVAREPVAIVGMGCRFPGGVADPEALWKLLAARTDAVSEFPADRGWHIWADASAADQPGQGGFLTDAAGFDAGFFGISPREALAMDPQQRLLLETSWEALERAGIDPAGAARQRGPGCSPGPTARTTPSCWPAPGRTLRATRLPGTRPA